ncbi:MAG: amidohydrolase, partial [Rhodospirillales bacterium]|nr:amidohydrolase [Rhodospirillales bacterium]
MTRVDCDVHPTVPSLQALLPYMDEVWRDNAVRRGIEELATVSYPTTNPLSSRADWRDPSGKAGTTVEALRAQALDPFGTDLAICSPLYGVQALFSEDMSAAFARALNTWTAREFLDRDPRLRASIVVPQINAERAVDEIEHWAGDHRFVQVLLLVGSELPLGRRQTWPIYAAAERHGLPVGIHAGSMHRSGMTPVGWTSTYTEDYVAQATAFQSQLGSLLAEGVFAKFPNLTVVL